MNIVSRLSLLSIIFAMCGYIILCSSISQRLSNYKFLETIGWILFASAMICAMFSMIASYRKTKNKKKKFPKMTYLEDFDCIACGKKFEEHTNDEAFNCANKLLKGESNEA